MAGRGPAPKHPSARARTNKVAGARTLHLVPNAKVPKLPPVRDWTPRARDWWQRVWSSPMAGEFDESDIPGLVRACELEDDHAIVGGLLAALAAEDPSALSPRDRVALAQQINQLTRLRIGLSAELRLVQQGYGLTPIDRRRLQWEIERGEEAGAKTAARKATPRKKAAGPDPRLLLAN